MNPIIATSEAKIFQLKGMSGMDAVALLGKIMKVKDWSWC
jgi:hypothetical protein